MAPVETYRDFYEYEAGTYAIGPEDEASWRHRRDLVLRLWPRDAGATALDVGCGDGALSRELAARGQRVVGLDLSLKRAVRARERVPEVAFGLASAYELPFPDRAFDTVVCTDLLEHLDEPERALRELVRVARGAVIVSVPYSIRIETTLCPHCGKDYYLYGHQHSFGREGLERLARGAGARVERFEHVIPMFECRRYKWFPPLKWLIWDHFKDTGTLGARIRRA
jgi:ubiquinone/menaquinone biosynthesis C-methylase UbiE